MAAKGQWKPAAVVSLVAHMAQDGSVVVKKLRYENPDFLAAVAELLRAEAALAAAENAGEIAQAEAAE